MYFINIRFIFQISFFSLLKNVKVRSFSHVRLFATSWIVAHQAPLSMGFSRQEYWSGLPFPSPGDLLDPGIKLRSPALQADALTSEPPGKPWKSESCSVVSDSLQSCGLYSPQNCLGQNTGVGSFSLLQGIFPSRDWTHVSHIAGGFFTNWATRPLSKFCLSCLRLKGFRKKQYHPIWIIHHYFFSLKFLSPLPLFTFQGSYIFQYLTSHFWTVQILGR